jgi:hypothetical protein
MVTHRIKMPRSKAKKSKSKSEALPIEEGWTIVEKKKGSQPSSATSDKIISEKKETIVPSPARQAPARQVPAPSSQKNNSSSAPTAIEKLKVSVCRC